MPDPYPRPTTGPDPALLIGRVRARARQLRRRRLTLTAAVATVALGGAALTAVAALPGAAPPGRSVLGAPAPTPAPAPAPAAATPVPAPGLCPDPDTAYRLRTTPVSSVPAAATAAVVCPYDGHPPYAPAPRGALVHGRLAADLGSLLNASPVLTPAASRDCGRTLSLLVRLSYPHRERVDIVMRGADRCGVPDYLLGGHARQLPRAVFEALPTDATDSSTGIRVPDLSGDTAAQALAQLGPLAAGTLVSVALDPAAAAQRVVVQSVPPGTRTSLISLVLGTPVAPPCAPSQLTWVMNTGYRNETQRAQLLAADSGPTSCTFAGPYLVTPLDRNHRPLPQPGPPQIYTPAATILTAGSSVAVDRPWAPGVVGDAIPLVAVTLAEPLHGPCPPAQRVTPAYFRVSLGGDAADIPNRDPGRALTALYGCHDEIGVGPPQ